MKLQTEGAWSSHYRSIRAEAGRDGSVDAADVLFLVSAVCQSSPPGALPPEKTAASDT